MTGPKKLIPRGQRAWKVSAIKSCWKGGMRKCVMERVKKAKKDTYRPIKIKKEREREKEKGKGRVRCRIKIERKRWNIQRDRGRYNYTKKEEI